MKKFILNICILLTSLAAQAGFEAGLYKNVNDKRPGYFIAFKEGKGYRLEGVYENPTDLMVASHWEAVCKVETNENVLASQKIQIVKCQYIHTRGNSSTGQFNLKILDDGKMVETRIISHDESHDSAPLYERILPRK